MNNEPAVHSELVSVLLEEYKTLRQEIQSRSSAQATVLSLNVTAIGLIAGLYFSDKADARVMFLIPIVSSILAALYIDHGINIGKLGNFIRWEVKPRLAQAVGVERLVDYEVHVHRYEESSRPRRYLLLFAIIFMFGVVPLVALFIPMLPLFVFLKSIVVGPEIPFPRDLDVTFWLPALVGGTLLTLVAALYWDLVRGAKAEMARRPGGMVEVDAKDSVRP